jgi:hypothetical protein
VNRYSPDDFEAYTLAPAIAAAVNPSAAVVEIGPLTLQADAEPPLKLFIELLDSSPKFKATFERRRKDIQDQSPSAYDMALVNAAVRAGWTDQQTANLIIYGRREHSLDVEKALRSDYIPTMLRKVRQGIAQDEAAEVLEDRYAEQRATGAPREIPREELLELVRRALEINIIRLTRYGEENPDYELVTDQGTVMLGKVEGLISHARLRNAIAVSGGCYIREFTRPRWRAVAQALLDLCETEDTGDGTTDQGQLQVWLDGYLRSRDLAEQNEAAILAREPFLRQGGAWVFLDSWSHWIFTRSGEHISAKWLAREMRRFGSRPVVIGVTLGGKRTSREVWPAPGAANEQC